MTDAALARRIMALIDLTNLDDGCQAVDVETLCRTARGEDGGGPVAAVCIWPRFCADAAAALAGSGIAIATVVNFPAGTDPREQVVLDAVQALARGATEIDCVLPWHAVLEGRSHAAATLLAAVRAAVQPPACLKIILETGELRDPQKIRHAAELAIGSGADFIKTSTGKTAVSATLEATAVMLEAIRASGREIGIKPSGGIRTLEQAAAFIRQAEAVMGEGWVRRGTFRIGASGLRAALMQALGSEASPPAGAY